jgi:oligosaccharide repeat unit polymerase
MKAIIYMIFFLFLLFLLKIRYKTVNNPFSIIIIVWGGAIILSMLSLTGFHTVSEQTYIIFSGAILSIFLGGMIPVDLKFEDNYIPVFKFKILLFIAGVILLPSLFVSFKYIISNGYYAYLANTRWTGGSLSNAFYSNFFVSLMDFIFIPISVFSFFMLLPLSDKKGITKKLFIVSVFFLFIYSFLITSRIEILMVFFSFCCYLFIKKKINISVKNLIYIVLFFLVVILLSMNRVNSNTNVIKSIFDLFVINYHTVGFSLFDKAINDPNSFFYEYTTYGLTSFSFLSIPYERISQLLYSSRDVAINIKIIGEMSKQVFIGMSNDNVPMYFNSFYTGLGALFIDFSYAMYGILFFYGFCLRQVFIAYRKYNSPYYLSIMLYLLYFSYNSLFFPFFIKQSAWLVFFIIFFTKRKIITK